MSDIQFLIAQLGNVNVNVVLPEATQRRLAGRCFRNGDWDDPAYVFALAGNSRWTGFGPMMRDATICNLLRDQLIAAINGADGKIAFTKRFTIRHPRMPIGWNSSATVSGFTEAQLEPFNLNKRGTGLRVRSDAGVLAPLTDLFTFVGSFTFVDRPTNGRHPEEWTVVLLSMYPGEDVRELDGDVTSRDGRAIFDWEHPGAPLP